MNREVTGAVALVVTDLAAHTLGEALSLWHGRALAELEDWGPGRAEAARLDGLRLDAQEQRWAAELAAGVSDLTRAADAATVDFVKK